MSGRRKDRAGGVWYVEGVRFECTRCGDCCRGAPGYVWVSPREVERIARFLGLEAATFRRQFVRKVGSRLSLKEGEDGDCVFYQEGCLIYPVRPTQCAIFPFWESNLRTPREWEQLALRCPGVNRGALHSATQIRMSLRADRASVSGRALPVPTVTSATLVEVQRLYRQVEGALAGECVRCGDCCRFGRGVPTLFASLLEVALVLRWLGEAPRSVGQVCPYLQDGCCQVYPVRPLGCRTYFCRDDSEHEHQARYERALSEVKALCRRALIPWRYERFLGLLREAGAGRL